MKLLKKVEIVTCFLQVLLPSLLFEAADVLQDRMLARVKMIEHCKLNRLDGEILVVSATHLLIESAQSPLAPSSSENLKSASDSSSIEE